MKKSYLIIITFIGITIIGATFFSLDKLNQDDATFTKEGAKIAIKGLNEIYRQDESIEFAIQAYGFNVGCESIRVQVFNEYKTQPPLYEKEFVAECNQNSKPTLTDYSFPIMIKQFNDGKSGKYVVVASFYQHRGSFGNIEQNFTVISQ
ncbi:MAG: hypothetical protein ABI337_02555 [Nitrososphaera sp.]|jgi:hypothetical protein